MRDTLPWWTPFKSWIAGKRYACIMLQPSREMLESVPEFLASAKNVIIDSTWSFEVGFKWTAWGCLLHGLM